MRKQLNIVKVWLIKGHEKQLMLLSKYVPPKQSFIPTLSFSMKA
jgi:hypothetical protein